MQVSGDISTSCAATGYFKAVFSLLTKTLKRDRLSEGNVQEIKQENKKVKHQNSTAFLTRSCNRKIQMV